MASDSIQWWQKYGTLGQMTQAVVTTFGVITALVQINLIKAANQEASARQIYLAYLEKEFKYPQFAVPDYERIKKASNDEQALYESFVAYTLYSCEEALIAFAGQPSWRSTCEKEVKVHLPFLCERLTADPTCLDTYARHTVAFVHTLITKEGATLPACAGGLPLKAME